MEEFIPTFLGKPSSSNSTFLEDLHEFKQLSKQIEEGIVDEHAVRELAMIVAKLHKSSYHTLYPGLSKLKEKYNTSEVRDEIRTKILTSPFAESHTSPHLSDALRQKMVASWNEPEARENVIKFQKLYDERLDCLIHGRLAPEAVYVNNGDVRLTDSGFVHVGSCALDLGTLIAHYVIAHYTHMLTEENNDAHRKVAYNLMDAIRKTLEIYTEQMQDCFPNSGKDFTREVAGFTGCEIISRCLGCQKLPSLRAGAQLEILEAGLRFFHGHMKMDSVGRLIFIGFMLC